MFFLLRLIKSLMMLTGSYSNNLFLEPLSSEDECKYLDLMQKGDSLARSKLIEHNLRLVAHIVKKFDFKSDFQDDLISIGTIGLIKGVDTYKNNKSVKLTTYCARCIQNEILMYYRSNNKNNRNVSLNDSIGYDKDGNEICLMDLLVSKDEDFIDDIHKNDNISKLKKYFNILDKRERDILSKRYGLIDKCRTQKEISSDMNISRSYVSRIEKRALIKLLREFIKNKDIE